jgi:hypothetical protein
VTPSDRFVLVSVNLVIRALNSKLSKLFCLLDGHFSLGPTDDVFDFMFARII